MHQKCKCKTHCKTHRTRKWKKCNCKNANAQKAFRTPIWFTFTGVNVSSAQVLLPCPGYFAASMCVAFGIFPFSQVAFLLSRFSTCHVASFQLALVPLVSFVRCATFQVVCVLSILSPFAIFAPFQVFPFVLQLSGLPLSDLHFWIPFACMVSPFFQDVNILEQAQFDSTTLALQYFSGLGGWFSRVDQDPF